MWVILHCPDQEKAQKEGCRMPGVPPQPPALLSPFPSSPLSLGTRQLIPSGCLHYRGYKALLGVHPLGTTASCWHLEALKEEGEKASFKTSQEEPLPQVEAPPTSRET